MALLPAVRAWDQLKAAILEAFRRGGGDVDAGWRTHMMLRERGAEDVRFRAAVVALAAGHPYLRLPIQFATSLKSRFLDAGIMTKSELDQAMAECEKVARDPQTTAVTFVLTQVWGRKSLMKPLGGIIRSGSHRSRQFVSRADFRHPVPIV